MPFWGGVDVDRCRAWAIECMRRKFLCSIIKEKDENVRECRGVTARGWHAKSETVRKHSGVPCSQQDSIDVRIFCACAFMENEGDEASDERFR